MRIGVPGNLFSGVRLCGLWRQIFVAVGLSVDDLHLLPIVGKFLAAIQAGNVGARKRRSLRKPLAGPLGDRETDVLVSATKQDIEQTRHIHHPPFRVPGKLTAGSNFFYSGGSVLQDMSSCT